MTPTPEQVREWKKTATNGHGFVDSYVFCGAAYAAGLAAQPQQEPWSIERLESARLQAQQPSLAAKEAYINGLEYELRKALPVQSAREPLTRAEIIAELAAGVEMPEPEIALVFDGWGNGFEVATLADCQKKTEANRIIGYTADQLRETVARAVAKKDAEIASIKNAIGNAQLAAFIEKHGEPVPLIAERDALKAENVQLREALETIAAFAAGYGDDVCEVIEQRARAALKGQP